jgi:hypothetical protein
MAAFWASLLCVRNKFGIEQANFVRQQARPDVLFHVDFRRQSDTSEKDENDPSDLATSGNLDRSARR